MSPAFMLIAGDGILKRTKLCWNDSLDVGEALFKAWTDA